MAEHPSCLLSTNCRATQESGQRKKRTYYLPNSVDIFSTPYMKLLVYTMSRHCIPTEYTPYILQCGTGGTASHMGVGRWDE